MFFSGFLFTFQSDLFFNLLSYFRCWIPTTPSFQQKNNPYIGLEDEIEIPRFTQTTKDSSLENDYFKNKKGVPI
jgi:hypothetical protein